MQLFEQFGINEEYVVIGACAAILIMLILLIIYMAKISGMKKRYKVFMDGNDGKNLEKSILEKFAAIDTLENDVKTINENIERIDKKLVTTYQKIGLVKYDAFKEIGGKMSFVLVLLTDENNGFILNSMHSTKEGCYNYTKEVENGEAFVLLSEEEQQALDEAKSFGKIKRERESKKK